MRRRLHLAPALLVAACLLFGIAWLITNPPGFAPDEPEHCLKAVGISQGDVFGAPAPFTYLPVVDAEMLRWQNMNTRSVQVPAGMGTCLYYRMPIYGRCPEGPPPPTPARQVTYVASYPPFSYVTAAALMRLGHTSISALLLGRLATLLLSTLLSGAAAALSRSRRGSLSLLGLVVSVTPMVLFTFSELSASGPEIASGLCFAAALIRLTDDDQPPGWLWLVLLLSGAVLALSRTFGPVWVGFDVCWAVALLGVHGMRLRLGAHRFWAWATGTAIGAAISANVGWQIAISPHPHVSVAALSHGVGAVLTGLPRLGREWIGVFGWEDVPLPRPAYVAWSLMIGLLLLTAFVLANRRERWVLLGLGCGAGLLTIAVAVAIAASAPGFRMQTRYVLPIAVALPLLAGNYLHRHQERISARLRGITVPAVILVAAALHAWAIGANAQFYLRNVEGRVSFIIPPGWRPPLGWSPWVTVIALGVVLLAAMALGGMREQSFRGTQP